VTDGIVVVDKPAGLTSHDVVARLRRIAGTRRVGHAGTLDPMATGVLVVGVGRGTRLLGHLAGTDKSYDATIRLGAATSTDDAEGTVTGGAPAGQLGEDLIRSAVATLVGPLDQVPSSVSALKGAGERAHAIVRRGGQVDLPARRVQVHAFEVDRVSWSGDHADLDVRVDCSSGTYVRALARDLGAELGVGGHLTRLRRTRVGAFRLATARTIDQLAERWEVLDLTTAALAVFPSLRVGPEQAQRVRHGARLDAVELPTVTAPVAVLDPDGAFLALYAAAEDDATTATAVAVFVG
jgi:tRNA pseudouridine55 synthase